MEIFDKGTAARLTEQLDEIKDVKNEWEAIYFAFDKLLEEYKSNYQIKIALNMMKDLLRHEEGGIYLCDDASVFLLAHRVSRQQLDKVIFQLRYLFMDDPIAYTSDGEENEIFCKYFNLENDYKKFNAIVKSKLFGKSSPIHMPKAEQGVGLINQVKEQLSHSSRFFNATSLANIEKKLSNVDLTSVIRKQPICASIPDTSVRRVFDELYLNISHLRQIMKIDVDLLSNRWLFKYLTELLDLRMLEILRNKNKSHLNSPISLNLNVKTLMSDSFLEFDASVKPSIKVSIVIEIQAADVFEDMRAFIIARNTVQKLGYRICLDGLTDLSFPQVNREKLGFDLVKLQWNADMPDDINTKNSSSIIDMIKECGRNRVILTRCDNKQAVDYGQALGISLFQGRYLDRLMNPSSTIRN